MNEIKKLIRLCLAVLAVSFAAMGCVEEIEQQPDYGFVQFRLIKSGSFAGTKASDGVLDSLYEASKIKVTLLSESNEVLSTTVPVMEADASLAEYGLQSEKIQLLKGTYTVMGYDIYDRLDKKVFSEASASVEMTVVPGGLTLQKLSIGTKERGFVKFRLVSVNDGDLDEIDKQLDQKEEALENSPALKSASSRSTEDNRPIHLVTSIDVTVENVSTTEQFTFTGLDVEQSFVEENGYVRSISVADSLVPVFAGEYKVIHLKTYFDKGRKVYEEHSDIPDNKFIVKDNKVTGLGDESEDDELKTADIPVYLYANSGYIKDAIALRNIWLEHDGPHWKEKGCRVLWNFDSEVNVWLAQPGVQILENGRIASLDLEGTGVSGKLSSHIGELTELRVLRMGDHTYSGGTSMQKSVFESGYYSAEAVKAAKEKYSFDRMFRGNQHPLARTFASSECILRTLETEKGIDLRMDEVPPIGWGDPTTDKIYASMVTELPDEINNLEDLETIYIAFSAIEKLPADMSGLKSLTDLEIYNCYDLKEFPKGIATLPTLVSLTFSNNMNVTEESMEDGLAALAAGNSKDILQILQIPNQNFSTLPDISGLINLGLLNISECGVETIAAPFGKDHQFAQFLASGNNLSSLPKDSEGYFVGMSAETEEINFSGNKFTLLPNIFNSESVYVLGTIDFSSNMITDVEGGEDYRGINCTTLNLNGNKLETWPEELFKSGSSITFLQLGMNGMTTVPEEAISGENIKWLNVLDLSNNRIKELPESFRSENLHYLEQLELSFNSFDKFPYAAANSQYILMFALRGQRNEQGYRCMKEWPSGIGDNLFRLRALYLGGNDIGQVTDKLSYLCYNLDISDNPNISIDVTNLCPYIKAGMFNLVYSPGQDIRGCDDGLILE